MSASFQRAADRWKHALQQFREPGPVARQAHPNVQPCQPEFGSFQQLPGASQSLALGGHEPISQIVEPLAFGTEPVLHSAGDPF